GIGPRNPSSPLFFTSRNSAGISCAAVPASTRSPHRPAARLLSLPASVLTTNTTTAAQQRRRSRRNSLTLRSADASSHLPSPHSVTGNSPGPVHFLPPIPGP